MRALLPLVLVACSGGGDDKDCTDDDCDPTDPCVGDTCDSPPTTDTAETGDTGEETTEPRLLPLVNLSFVVEVGWDDAAGQTRATTWDGVSTPSTLRVLFGTPTFDLDLENTDAYCAVLFDIDGLTEAAWADGEGWWLGLEVHPDPTRVIEDGCTPRLGVDFSPDTFTVSPAEDVSGWFLDVGIGDVGGVPTGSTTTGTPFLIPGGVGVHDPSPDPGDIYTEFVTTPTVRGYAVDAGFGVQDDGTGGRVPLDPATVETPTGVASGLYEVTGAVYFGWP